MNNFRIAGLSVDFMQALGYERFAAQGGDIGAGVSTALGLRHAGHIIGIHLNYIPGSYRPHLEGMAKPSAAEQKFLADAARWYDENGAYAHIQATRSQTAAFGLNDSPAGLAAWILEKFRNWSDCGGDLYASFTRDELAQQCHALLDDANDPLFLPAIPRKPESTVASWKRTHLSTYPARSPIFQKRILFPPREWVERGYNVQRWTEMPRGGHFAAAEQPELLAKDMRAFFRFART